MNTAIGVFVSFAALCYPFTLSSYRIIGPSPGSLDTMFAGLGMFGVLFNLGIAYLLVGIRYGFPWWSWLLALPVTLFFVVSALGVTDLLKDQQPVRWMISVPALGPLLILAYMAWAAIPRLHSLLSPSLATWILWVAIFILAMIPTPRTQALDQKKAELKAQAERASAEIVALAKARQEQLEKLPPNTPTADLLPYVNFQETEHQAQLRIRAAKDKESYFEQAMKSGDYSHFYELFTFELAPTPGLCDCVRTWLRQHSTAGRTVDRNDIGGDIPISSYLFTLESFASSKCPMLDELNGYEAALRATPDTAKWVFERLDGIKQKLRTD